MTDLLDRHAIERELGRGSMAVLCLVYQAGARWSMEDPL